MLLSVLASVSLAVNVRPQPQDVAAPPAQAAALRDIVASGRLADLRWPDFSDYKVLVDGFYAPASYAPAWVRGGQPSASALSLVQVFRDVWKRGLEPEDYDASRWDARLQALKNPDADPARFDVALTVCAMRLVSDLRIGRINPQHFDFGLSVEGKKYDLPHFLRERLTPAAECPPCWTASSRRSAAIDGRRRRWCATSSWRGAMAWKRYPSRRRPSDRVRRTLVWRRLDGASLSWETSRLKRRRPPIPTSTAARWSKRSSAFSAATASTPTAISDRAPSNSSTYRSRIASGNYSWRSNAGAGCPWISPSPPIVVNIPDFRLRAADAKGNVVMDMRVVVGKAAPTQTPVFTREMTYVVFRPYWNVPPSIRRGEIVPAIQRDRNYIAKKRYEVTTNDGKVVTDGPISDDVLAQLKAGQLAVRQKPGPTNSLGLVKLIFPNEYNVYLHSTPSAALFAKSRRDFSHGCIRVEKPAELAAWVLRNNPDWTLERVRQAMQSGPGRRDREARRPCRSSSSTGRRSPTRTARCTSTTTSTATTPTWLRRWPRATRTRERTVGGQLPAPDAPDVDVDEVGTGVVPDSAAIQTQRRIAKLGGRHARNADIDRHRLHVQALPRDAVPALPQVFVRGRRAITADHVDLGVGPPEGSQQVAEQIEKARVVRVDVVLPPVAQDSIDPCQRGGIVPIRVPVHDFETLPGVEMVEAQAVRLSGRGPHARDGGSRRDEHADEANERQETPRCIWMQ